MIRGMAVTGGERHRGGWLEAGREFVECDPDTVARAVLCGEFVVAAAQLLHERVPSRDRSS